MLHFLVIKCEQTAEYGTIKSLIVRISPLYYFLTVRLKIFYLKVTLFKMLDVSKILIISNLLPACLQVKTNRNFNCDGRERILKVDDLKSNVFNLMFLTM